jgi:3-oxoacyl-[acyl-carrier-protein] synthase II
MKRRRVKITGIGPVTPAGIGCEAFWQGILEPLSRTTGLRRFPDGAGAFVAAEVRDFKLERFLPDVVSKRIPRHTQFALAGAKLALDDAGLKPAELRGRLPVVVVGASLMDFGAINKGVELIVRRGPINGLPTTVFSASVSSISGAIGELIGGTTRTLALQSACCAGVDAIGKAAEMIAQGESEIAICGGTEAPLYFHPMLELKMAGLAPGNPEFPERQCRPFDLWRTTGVIGEGACIFVLEPEESPRRGYAFVEGYAFASDPADRPGAGLVEAMQLSLANAGQRPGKIDHISAWGPGHRVIDAAEAQALHRIFNSALAAIPVSSIKGAIGNPLGAAGAIQVGCAALGLVREAIPPTVNWQFPDPECPLNLSGRARHVRNETVLVNSHGLSGTNSCLVLKR